jgi:hypothetical protein
MGLEVDSRVLIFKKRCMRKIIRIGKLAWRIIVWKPMAEKKVMFVRLKWKGIVL